MMMPRSYSGSASRPSGSTSLNPSCASKAFHWCTSPWTRTARSSRNASARRPAQASAWSTARSEHGRSSSSQVATMKSASQRAFSAPVGRPQPGAGRHTRTAVEQRISWRLGSAAQARERPAETFEQERAARGIVSQQSHASFPAGEPQDGDLVLGRVTATGHDQLQHGRGAVGAGRLRDESLRRVAVGVADRDGPFLLHARDQQWQVVQPSARADHERLLAHHFGNPKSRVRGAGAYARLRLGKPPNSPYPPDPDEDAAPVTELADLVDAATADHDWANRQARGLAARRAEIRRCRLTGAELAEAIALRRDLRGLPARPRRAADREAGAGRVPRLPDGRVRLLRSIADGRPVRAMRAAGGDLRRREAEARRVARLRSGRPPRRGGAARRPHARGTTCSRTVRCSQRRSGSRSSTDAGRPQSSRPISTMSQSSPLWRRNCFTRRPSSTKPYLR